jgi:hypothetical protein
MSSLSSVSNSAGVSYATQLAQSSALERSLYNLGSAVQSGDLTTAGSVLTALIQANPQFAASSSSSGSTQSQSPINQDFQNLANAISSNDPDTAQSVWTQLKSDLAAAGVTNISSPSNIAAQTLASNKLSEDQTLLSSLFGGGSDGSSTLDTLLGGGGSSDSSVGSAVNSAISNWLTYQSNGNATIPANTIPTGSSLNTTA